MASGSADDGSAGCHAVDTDVIELAVLPVRSSSCRAASEIEPDALRSSGKSSNERAKKKSRVTSVQDLLANAEKLHSEQIRVQRQLRVSEVHRDLAAHAHMTAMSMSDLRELCASFLPLLHQELSAGGASP